MFLNNEIAVRFMIPVYKVLIIIVYLTRQSFYLFIPIKSFCERKLKFHFWNKERSHGFIKNPCIINLASSFTNIPYYFFYKNIFYTYKKIFCKSKKLFKYMYIFIFPYIRYLFVVLKLIIFILIVSNRAYSMKK